MVGVLAKKGCMWNASTYDCDRDKACKIDAYLEIKNCLSKKRFFGKLV